ncbi:MAG: hypothetical protein WBQ21_14695 [Solirubrobacteraceae bacterium]
MKLKLLLCLACVLSGSLLVGTSPTALAQALPGLNFGIGQPSIANLFNRPFTATADLELRHGADTATVVMGLSASDGKVRMYLDLGKAQGVCLIPAPSHC